jgi:hypothetical protein
MRMTCVTPTRRIGRGLLLSIVGLVLSCGGEDFDDAGPELGADAGADAGDVARDASVASDAGVDCVPGEVQDDRLMTGGDGCEAGEREEELTCNDDGSAFEWRATTEFDGSLRECEPGAVESQGEGCDEEERTCSSTCTWGDLEPVLDCPRDQVVFVNFDGVTIEDCPGNCEDPKTNKSLVVGAEYGGMDTSWSFAPFTRSRADKDAILNKLSGYFAAFVVRFVDERPVDGDYTMAVVSDTHFLPNHGVCPLDCDNSSEQICMVNNITDNTTDTIARFVAHELGHSFGLHHVDNAAGIMNWDSSGSSFTASPLTEAQACGLTLGQTQDAPAILAANLGLRDEVNIGATCHVDGVEGACIDTVADTCTGTVHVGACPGPAEIRCCTP